jgi:prepilin-type processing-associated H-X9-DG protein
MTLSANRRTRGFGYLDVIVVIGVLVLVVAFFLPTRRHTGETSSRVKCASNLRQIGTGLLLYANENGRAYPRMRHDETAGVRYYTGSKDTNPFDGVNDPLPNDITAAIFLLVRTQDMGTEVFTCPSAQEERFSPSDALSNYANFPGRKHLSYAIANPYPSAALVGTGYKWDNTLGPEFAVAADMGSGVDQSKFTVKSPVIDINKRANSKNHSQDGQNVLFGDGHVEFTNTPLAGVNKDNIYAPSAGPVAAPGTADASLPPGVAPQHADDSVLIPTEKD